MIRKWYIFCRHHRFSFYDVDAGSILDNVRDKVAFFVVFPPYFDYLVNKLDGHPRNTVAYAKLASRWPASAHQRLKYSADAAVAVGQHAQLADWPAGQQRLKHSADAAAVDAEM